MAYVAMARKWRPQSFSDMVGQEHIAKTLENAITGGRLHHAFLFTGTRGVGKTTSARILARTLNCTGGDPLHPCGQCESCKSILSGNSMDVFEIDAASNTGVDNIREVIEKVQYPPVLGKYKIFIIDEVHMLSTAAFNALLKTLEEPPEHVIFIFATTEVNKVLPTILSRVQRFDFKRLTVDQIRGRLRYICEQEGITASDETLNIFAEKADGSMRDGLTFFDQAYAFTGNNMDPDSVRNVLGIPPVELFFTLINAIESHDLKSCFMMVDEACKRGIEFTPLLDGFGKFLRNLLYTRLEAFDANALNLTDELYAKYKNTTPSLKNGDILRISKMLTDLQGTLRYSTNPRLLVETTFARMAWLDHLADLRRALAAINDPTKATGSASDEALKKKVAEVSAALDSSEGASSFPEDNPYDAIQNAFSGNDAAYSRYDIVSAWGAIRTRIADEDFMFSAALNDTVLETGDPQMTPFPIALTYIGDNVNTDSWSYKQMMEHPEYLDRVKQILEEKLQTPVEFSVKTRTFNAEERERRYQATLSALELDLQKEPGFQKFMQTFNSELIMSFKPKKKVEQVQESEQDSEIPD